MQYFRHNYMYSTMQLFPDTFSLNLTALVLFRLKGRAVSHTCLLSAPGSRFIDSDISCCKGSVWHVAVNPCLFAGPATVGKKAKTRRM